MTTTAATLRPLGLGELLDQSIRLYRRNFPKFIGIMALIQVPIGLLQLVFTLFSLDNYASTISDPAMAQDPNAIIRGAFGFMSSAFISAAISIIFISGIATAALTRAVADSYLGKTTGILDAYRRIGDSWLRLIAALLLASLLIIALIIWTIIPCIGWLSGLGMLIFFGVVIFPLIAPIVVLERRGATMAIRRAWELARRRFWWILGFVFVLYLFSQLIISGPSMLITLALDPFTPPSATTDFGGQSLLSTVVQSALSLILGLLYLPLSQTAITLLYIDLRVRTEGFDLALLAREASGQTAAVEDLAVNLDSQIKTPLITGTEFGYFVVITLGGAILYFVFIFVIIAIMGAASSLFGGF